ncbi:MAG: hypothetical protein ABSH41_26210, partial [Syntrophobacteraceae bacterium]
PHMTEWEMARNGIHPCAAIIVNVWGERLVNLVAFDANGMPFSKCSVTLLQDDDPEPEDGYFCKWMDYQKGQAAKVEELEKKSGAAVEDPEHAAVEDSATEETD